MACARQLKRCSYRIFSFDSVNPSQWDDFSAHTDKLCHISPNIFAFWHVNRMCEYLHTNIIASANAVLPARTVIYKSVHLENDQILRTNKEFQGSWYRKVLLIFKFFRGSFKEPYELAIVRCYDIFFEQPELYGCPQLHYTKEYNAIPISSIYQEAHVIPRFDKDNRFLLNKYIF
ncbi:hypothetical protein GLOIN_2v1817096 [Rhizophagus clarus]|uniref:Uncharacterized protein n=1 Tax=Rhizophagus clarus TaxID=94130 RepID=A0A8H3QLH0_9GLOM|nr:hypothetical protein GLOIN_2v1817096 [Rhizophagus clarus]